MSLHRKQVSYSSKNSHAARAAHARGKKEFSTYDTSALRPKQSKTPMVVGAIVAVLLALAMLWAVNHFVIQKIFSSSSAEYTQMEQGAEITVSIPEGATTKEVADILGKSGLIESSRDFTKQVKKVGAESSLKPGTYHIVAGTSQDDIIKMLEEGPAAQTVTIPEGYTLENIATAVEEGTDGQITAKDFKQAASDASKYADSYSFLQDAGTNSLEGFLFPKTYDVREDDTADTLIRAMLDQYASEVATLDYSYPKKQGLSEYDTLILASIIEKEADSENRAKVASVFYNRLEEGMALQSDATVAYVVGDDPTPEDLEIDSPYNTYLVDGLPKAPICSPSLASLQAACDPEKTDYLYFYFAEDKKGNMVYSFSETYDDHMDAIEDSQD